MIKTRSFMLLIIDISPRGFWFLSYSKYLTVSMSEMNNNNSICLHLNCPQISPQGLSTQNGIGRQQLLNFFLYVWQACCHWIHDGLRNTAKPKIFQFLCQCYEQILVITMYILCILISDDCQYLSCSFIKLILSKQMHV